MKIDMRKGEIRQSEKEDELQIPLEVRKLQALMPPIPSRQFVPSQFDKVKPASIPQQYKLIKVERIKESRRIYTTFFIPKEWEIIKIHSPIKEGNGVWVYIEGVFLGEQLGEKTTVKT